MGVEASGAACHGVGPALRRPMMQAVPMMLVGDQLRRLWQQAQGTALQSPLLHHSIPTLCLQPALKSMLLHFSLLHPPTHPQRLQSPLQGTLQRPLPPILAPLTVLALEAAPPRVPAERVPLRESQGVETQLHGTPHSAGMHTGPCQMTSAQGSHTGPMSCWGTHPRMTPWRPRRG